MSINVSSTQEFNSALNSGNGTTLSLQFPAQANLLLCEVPLAEGPQADIEKVATCAGRSLICVDFGTLALRTAQLLEDQEVQRIVGVGTSGIGFAQRINAAAPTIQVKTLEFSKQRALRQLSVEGGMFEVEPVLVDDVVVSGRTLEVVNSALLPSAKVAATGLLFNSKSTRRLAGVADLRAAVVYAKAGGGNPNINSVSTLLAFPDRLDELAVKCFGGQAQNFKTILRRSLPCGE